MVAARNETPSNVRCAARSSMLLIAARFVDGVMAPPDLGRPSALDEGENGNDVVVRELVLKGRHGTAIVRSGVRRDAELGQIEENVVRVMPSVAAGVVRWCRQQSVGPALAPVCLTFQLGSMA